MKTISILVALFFTTSVLARPSGFYLVTPKKLEVKNGQELEVTFDLPCKNQSSSDWSEVVMSSDDSGDRELAVGIVAAASACRGRGKSEHKKSVDLRKQGLNPNEDASTFHPMKVQKSNF